MSEDTPNLPAVASGDQKLSTFAFEGEPVRVMDRDGEPWFILADVCRVLEIANSRDAASRLDDDERGVVSTDTLGGIQNTIIISESGFYSTILTSRKDKAKRVKKWVTSEVLPAIRKTGFYASPGVEVPQAPRTYLEALEAAVKLERANIALTAQVADMRLDLAVLEKVAGTEGTFCVTDAAKHIGESPRAVFDHLRKNGWVYKRAGTNADIPYQSKINSGLIRLKMTLIDLPDGTSKAVSSIRLTPKGVMRIGKEFGKPVVEAPTNIVEIFPA